MKGKIMFATILMILLFAGIAFAVPDIEYVKINGDIHEDGDQVVVKRGEDLTIKVKVQANNSEDNVKVEAYIDGYEYDDREPVSDSESVFDMDAGDTEYVSLHITIPRKAEKDYYDLKVRVGTRRGPSQERQFRINLKGERHELDIRKILMQNTITAGRGLFANVKVENFGQKDEDDITIRFEIPELGIEEFTTIDEIEAEDSTTSEDIVVFIDECTEAGEYDVLVTVEYNEYDEITKAETLTVKASDACEKTKDGEAKTLVSVPQPQDVLAGDSAVFPIMLTNLGNKAKTYVISVSKSVETFGSYRVDPGNVLIVQPDDPKTVFVFVTVNDDVAEGAKDFIVTIESGDEKQDIALTANVISGKKSSPLDLTKTLEIGLVALIIILVIVGLVYGINRMKPKEEEEPEEELGQTYY